MPVGEELYVLKNLHRSLQLGLTPVIVLTGSLDKAIRQEVSTLGVQGYMYKPYDHAALAEQITPPLSGEQDNDTV